MLAARLTVDDVAAALKGANLVQPVGHYPQNGVQHLVIASALWKSVDDIADTPVVLKGGATVRVRDLGSVHNGAPDRTSLIVGQGGNATAINVSQQVGANILSVRQGLEDALTQLKTTLPAGLKLVKTYDLAEFVESAIANVRDAILIGAFLAVLGPARVSQELAADDRGRLHAADHGDQHVLLHEGVRRNDQPDVDGRPGRRHRSGDRRCRGRGGKHPSPAGRRRRRRRGGGRHQRAGRAHRGLHAHNGGRVRDRSACSRVWSATSSRRFRSRCRSRC
jgi:hypothetical protein